MRGRRGEVKGTKSERVLSRALAECSVEPGEVVGLLGRNGAGKTTLMHTAMGMILPQEGSVRVFGLDPVREAVAVKKRVGFVSEDQLFPPFLRVAEIIELTATVVERE